jgi:hypothetical protein
MAGEGAGDGEAAGVGEGCNENSLGGD